RDVKPSNLLQAGPDSWRLADFGIARTADSSLTVTGQFLGTPSFAAPEALEGLTPGAATDVYSLAATLYSALIGEPPYGNAGLAQIVVAMSDGQLPEAVAVRRPEVPAAVAAAIDRGLALDAARRPTAAELGAALAVDHGEVAPAGAAVLAGAGASSPARR